MDGPYCPQCQHYTFLLKLLKLPHYLHLSHLPIRIYRYIILKASLGLH